MLSETNIFLNASGCWCSNEEQINSLFNSNLGSILIKTCTLEPKNGNVEPNYYKLDDIHINSKGLPNNGYQYYKDLYKKISSLNKKFILSVAWENIDKKTIRLLEDYNDTVNKKELVELNLSCPNVHQLIPSYDCEYLELILKSLNDKNFSNLYFSLKLSPYLDHSLCKKVINVINNNNNNNLVKYVVLSNSIPNCLILNDNKSVLSNIYGGLSGKLNKFIALSNVHFFKDKLNKDIKIIGCGGIETIDDVNDYLNNGASFVQLGSCFYNNLTNTLDYEKINYLINEYKEKNI
jgi:dihydroorotate dehydrogenase (fumarate)